MSNLFFNANLYLAKNPDLAAAGLQTPEQLWTHYINYGAQESLTVASRAPNSWFDVSFYLTSNPDLGAAGITANMALNHYAQYGVHEGRLFNPHPDLAPTNFNAKTYAQQNPDLVAAYGIMNPNNPSAAESGDLLMHFLAYGFNENRPGVTASFAALVDNVNNIDLDPIFAAFPSPSISYGTVADDAFFSTANTANKTVNGLAGEDSITFGVGANTGTGANAITLQNIEKVIVANNGAVSFQSNQLLDVEINAGSGAVAAGFSSAAVAGQNDLLEVTSKAVTTNFSTNGIEHLNFDLDSTSTAVTANANQAQGSSLVVELNNGSNAGVTTTVESTGSTALTQLAIDGSDLTGPLILTALGAQASGVQHITVYGSTANVAQNFAAAANSITGTAASGATFTVEGGAGVDTFRASNAIDTFKGGGGNDIFNMGGNAAKTLIKASAGSINAVDTILDFTNGDVVNTAAANIVTGTGAIPANATLEQLVTGVSGTLTDGDVFGFDNDAYILVHQDSTLSNVSLVKLAGVDVADLQVTGGTVVDFA